ncbi:MAG: anti-sigma factor family protein [Gemmatimonadaceae bacterium]
MLHLEAERLAALADEESTVAERSHLAVCAECARELGAYVALRDRARSEGGSAAPLTHWNKLAAQLSAEGLVRKPESVAARRASSGRAVWWMQAAAALLFMAGGVTMGWLGARASARNSVVATAGSVEAESRNVSVASVGGTNPVDTLARFTSLVEAQAVLTRAEREYRQAMTYLAINDTTTAMFRNSDVYRARLAALDAMAGAARDGVNELPHDPIMNQYYMSTLAAREATLRQLGGTLPAGVRLTRF